MKFATEMTDCWGMTSYDSFSATTWVSAPAITVRSPVIAVTSILHGEKMVTWPVAGASPFRLDADVGSDDFDGVGIVATEGERADAEFDDGALPGMRGVEAAVGVCRKAKAGGRDANVGRAADVGTDIFAGEDAGAFGERALANVSEIRLEHDAKRRVLRR